MKLRDFKTVKERRIFFEGLIGKKLSAISEYPDELNIAQTGNCENMVGAISVPLGIAGPVKINGNFAQGDYYLPLATTEAALVASVNRGCKAIKGGGGVTSVCTDVGITRGSVFETGGIRQSQRFQDWIEKNKEILENLTSGTSSHIKLLNIKVKPVSKYVFVRFSFDTMEAMGMNMSTFAADKLAKYIEEKTEVNCISLAGNFDNDKKPSYLNFLEGRGRSVQSEILLDRKILGDILKTTPQKFDRVVKTKINLGSQLSGSLAINAHFANILTAMYIALGQDVAHVAEGSVGITTTEIVGKDLYIAVFLPDLPLGTVGGGTGLPAQSEALSILGIKGGEKGEQSKKLAEIVGGAVLAGELSLLSALSVGALSAAHKKMTGKTKNI